MIYLWISILYLSVILMSMKIYKALADKNLWDAAWGVVSLAGLTWLIWQALPEVFLK